ncbi:TetR family transcriptional regulator C-terminal domain-containing protein [Myxococcus qinghaiensis]|uniref:TetR family transcriptional regulator C-terminal domain-containing protein n=1 Tax=Myxococcus qinghaiensis TaxID=2906758 RepID=UPI0038991D31
MAQAARIAVAEGHFHKDVDVEQFAHDENALLLGFHHSARLLKEPRAETWARRAFDALLRAARPQRS